MADTILPVKVMMFPGPTYGTYIGKIVGNDETALVENMNYDDAVFFAAAVNTIGPALALLGQSVPYITQVAVNQKHKGVKDTLAAINELGEQWNKALWGESDG